MKKNSCIWFILGVLLGFILTLVLIIQAMEITLENDWLVVNLLGFEFIYY